MSITFSYKIAIHFFFYTCSCALVDTGTEALQSNSDFDRQSWQNIRINLLVENNVQVTYWTNVGQFTRCFYLSSNDDSLILDIIIWNQDWVGSLKADPQKKRVRNIYSKQWPNQHNPLAQMFFPHTGRQFQPTRSIFKN